METTAKKLQPYVSGEERPRSPQGGNNDRGGNRGRGPRRDRPEREAPEFDSRTVEIARVTRVMAGGKRMRFRALVVLGDRKGKVGFGLAKGADVTLAVGKATNAAKKAMVKISMDNGTVPHALTFKYKSAVVLIKPAPQGTGLKAGGAARIVLELAGLQNVVSKIMNSANKVNNVKATIAALKAMKPARN